MTQSGRLGVRVYAARAQLPVEGATVAITQKTGNGKYKVISLQETDRNGKIRPVHIPTPGRQESTRPNEGEVPFARCDIWVEEAGYELMVLEDVQVFPGVLSEQQVELEPLVRGEQWTQSAQVRPISPQDL